MSISNEDMVTVRPGDSFLSKQQLVNFEGISAHTAGSKALCMHMVVFEPGGKAASHYHDGYETVIYMLKGRVKTLYGVGLKKEMINEAGDFIFIPANVPHLPMNLSDTEEAVAIVARNDPNEQESVILYNPSE
jgi:uncharacterized RmlC-like cupin family protein